MDDKLAVLDIGSNTVRLSVLCGAPPDHRRLVDSKVACRLAEGLGRSGKLSPQGVLMAFEAIGSYLADAAAAGAGSVQLVATAAVREAADGPAFAAELERRFGYPVRILSGDDEARLSARGVLSGIERADGLVADLGGGSLELIEAADGVIRRMASRPLGHIRLAQQAGTSRAALDRIIIAELGRAPWIVSARGKRIYLAGGAFRKLARRHIAKHAPGASVHGYMLPAEEMKRFIESRRNAPTKASGQSAAAAMRLLACLLDTAQPGAIEFSTRGLCDGCYVTSCAEAAA